MCLTWPLHAGCAAKLKALQLLHGDNVEDCLLRERLGGLDFVQSPLSFFQTNPGQAEALLDVVARAAGTHPENTKKPKNPKGPRQLPC